MLVLVHCQLLFLVFCFYLSIQSSFALYFSWFGSRVFSPHNNTGLEARLEIIVNGMDPRTDTFFPSNCSLQISEGWLQLQATFPATVAVSRPETYLGIIRTIETLDTAAVQYCGRAHVVVELFGSAPQAQVSLVASYDSHVLNRQDL